MFYVCKKRDDGTFGVMDTEDGVVDYFTPKELGRIVTKFKVDIDGVSVADGKIHLTVKRPLQFADVESTNVNIDTSGSSLLETGFASQFRGLEENTPYPDFIEKYSDIASVLVKAVDKLAGRITGLTAGSVVGLDGWDCIGFDYVVSSLDSAYAISVYANPQVTVAKEGNGYKLIGVDASGFGCDIMRGRNIVEHIDCGIKTWMKDIEESDGWKLLNDVKNIKCFDCIDKSTFDELVRPLYERIAYVASKVCNMKFSCSHVIKFGNSWDLVGIKQQGVKFNLYDIDVHVQSTGCWYYNKDESRLPLDVIVEFWNTSGIDKVDIPFKYHKYVIVSKNNITINIPENEFEDGLNAAVAVKRYITNIQ